MIGTMLGSYRIESEAGAGGMGVVYRAVDVTLKRAVALKIINAAALVDPDRKRRFVQEARAASALNHPDIVTIYQIGTDGPVDFIAMEFVEGRALAEMLHGRPLPLADARRYAIRIAGALAAAHHAGIVHRDLKPANVMVTDKGGIKLLDFGVAKLMDRSTAETVTMQAIGVATAMGVVVGTLAYMSPEQARGATVDARSDIYSFGIVLHEMLVGHCPDRGAATALDSVPRDLRRIVARCLQTEPDRRFQVMDDVQLALEEADLDDASVTARTSAPAIRSWHVTLGALIVAAAAGGLAWRMKPQPVPRHPVVTRLTMDSALTIDPALSPDGRLIAFASDRSGDGNMDIWVRQVAGGDPIRLTSDPADDTQPSFSPDGSHIAFRSDRDGGGVYVVPSLGGDARRIIDDCRRPRWSPSADTIVCWSGLNTAFLISQADALRVYAVAASGGEAHRLFGDFAAATAPIWSADGTALLFLGRREAASAPAWWVASADGTSPVETAAYDAITQANLLPTVEGLITPDAWMADGRVLFSARLGDVPNIWGLAVAAGGRVTGDPQPLTSGTTPELGAAVDRAGTLAFSAMTSNMDLWSLPADTAAGTVTGAPQAVTHDPATDLYPWLSADGTRIVFGSNRSGRFDVWLKDLVTGKESALVSSYRFPSLPSLTKDGSHVIFQSQERWRWLSVPISTAGMRTTAPQVICDRCESFWDVSTGNRWAVFGERADTEILVREVATRKTFPVLNLPGMRIGRIRISPDDRWMAFTVRKRGAIAVQIAPFHPGPPDSIDEVIAITPDDTYASAPIWSPDGGMIYYFSDRDGRVCIWTQRIDRATGRPVGAPFAVWHFHEPTRSMLLVPLPTRGLAVSRDRIVVTAAESTGNIWVSRRP